MTHIKHEYLKDDMLKIDEYRAKGVLTIAEYMTIALLIKIASAVEPKEPNLN